MSSDAREALDALGRRLQVTRLGKSAFREMDKDIIAMRKAERVLTALLADSALLVDGNTSDGHHTFDEREALVSLIETARTPMGGTLLGSRAQFEAVADTILAAGFRRTEVPEPITEEQINAERERQIEKGYTSDHDRKHGIAHVLRWALHYGSRGEHLKAYAMVEAALEIAPPDPGLNAGWLGDQITAWHIVDDENWVEPQGEPSSEVPEPTECRVCHRMDGSHKMSCRPQNRRDAERYAPTDGEREVLGDVWDDGNAVGLDGWVGPGRGTEPIDDHAERARERAIEKYAPRLRRSEVPEPSAEGWSTADRQEASAEAHRRFDEWAETRGQDIAGASINGFILGAEWWKATHRGPEPQDEPSGCSNPDCPLERAHSGPCAPKGWQGEPSDARRIWQLLSESIRGEKDGTTIPVPVEDIRALLAHRATQGEPSDAQVDAALRAYKGYYREDDGPGDPSRNAMRAALRAAREVER